jgi:hypothetical protein
MAAILIGAGLVNSGRSLSRSRYLDALAWSSMIVGGVALFVVMSLFPRRACQVLCVNEVLGG